MNRCLAGLLAIASCVVWCLPVLAAEIVLSDQCPPGFALEQGACRLYTRYDGFASVQQVGVGGTRTGLPPRRDGFSAQQIDLGRYLFFDPLLSEDGSLACASCHLPERGFADGLALARGADGQALQRAAPTLWNVAFMDRLFWDGRARSLEDQLDGPLFAANEMGNTPESLMARVNADSTYLSLFRQAFPGRAGPIELAQLKHALAAFEASLVSLNSRYDRYALGHAQALSEQELKGLNVFRSFVARCAECHTPPLFSSREIAVIGAPEADGVPFDAGAGAVLQQPRLRGGFRVPTLRNIDLTAPYMHSGRFASLAEVADFYNGGRGHAAPESERLYLHWHIVSPELRDDELTALVAFLSALQDESFMPAVPQALPSGLDPLTYRRHTLATANQ